MTDLSSYLQVRLLRHILRGEFYVPPAQLYVALFTLPTNDEDTTPELDKGGYTRQVVRFAIPAQTAIDSLNVVNASVSTSELRFGPAAENWGELTHFALYDAPFDGNMLLHGPLDISTVIDAGQVFVFDLGGVIVSFE